MARKMEWVEIPHELSSQLQHNQCILSHKVKGKNLCLVRHGSEIFAVDARCPHSGGPLAAGFINEKEEIVCPWHRIAFELRTGQCQRGGYFINSYETKVEAKRVWVKLPKKLWGLF